MGYFYVQISWIPISFKEKTAAKKKSWLNCFCNATIDLYGWLMQMKHILVIIPFLLVSQKSINLLTHRGKSAFVFNYMLKTDNITFSFNMIQ